MWELSVELIALAVILTAALVQLSLAHVWPKKPAWRRRRWTYVLVVLVIAGAIANGIGAWQTHVNQSEARERIERAGTEREQQVSLL